MKRLVTILLVAVLMLSLAACSGSTTPNENTTTPPSGGNSTTPEATPAPTIWGMIAETDDFGDATGKEVIIGEFAGSFSNTATSDSNLTVYIFCYLLPNGNGAFSIRLLEYNRTKATFTSSDASSLTIRTRVDGNDNEHSLIGQAPNSDLMIDTLSGILFFQSLYDEKEVSCIVDIASSRYSFTIDGMGFAELFDEMVSNNIANNTTTLTGEVISINSPINGICQIKVEKSDNGNVKIGDAVYIRLFDSIDSSIIKAINVGDTITVNGVMSGDMQSPELIEHISSNLSNLD